MSVASKNPFALLDAEDASRPSSPVAVPVTDAPTPPTAPARGSQKPRGGPAARGGKYYSRGGKPAAKDVNPNQTVEELPTAEGERKAVEGGRGRGRGGRGGPGRGGRGRQYDRHSQTGRIDTDKRIHQSWGGDDGNTELKAEEAATVDAAVESTANDWAGDAPVASEWGVPDAGADAWAAPAPDAAAVTTPVAEGERPEGRQRREREPEEEDNTLTLDQYLAQQKEKDSVVPKLENTRKANEGADANIWKDVVPLAKNEEENAYFVGKSKNAPKPRAKKEEKVYLEIDARFERPDRGGRGRGRGGDRGGDRGDRGRGGRGRGGARGGRQNGSPVINVDDQTAFPSLS
ncbi:hypothetical protein K443DRAFT_673841 [Laccaria amethystina LaAM-08-1]|uniref:Hyaluronan/mRNA-binding protein domain-containing protein n=1 Tax=Laccaria amethystina LaAM-08-1 TaxID=1095629 RepID=A0A0C9Y9R5_9AGAR|nr:hypothetical protein K443DRAFT_673841 [Laccaria amethystina LaAM-08-1]